MKLEDVVGAFGITPTRIRKSSRAWVNEVWLVVDETCQRFALKRVTPVRTTAEVEHEHTLLRGLADAGWSVPNPIPALDGSTILDTNGGRYWLAPWLPGRSPSPSTTAFGSDAGRLLAELHIAATKVETPAAVELRLRRFRDWPFEPLGHTLARGVATDGSMSRELRRRVAAAVEDVAGRLAGIGPSPVVMTHFDFHYANLLLDDDHTAVLDFDFAHPDERVADIATALAFIPRTEVAESFVAGYASVAPLTDDETAGIEAFYDARKLLHAGWLFTHPDGQDVESGLDHALAELGSCPFRAT